MASQNENGQSKMNEQQKKRSVLNEHKKSPGFEFLKDRNYSAIFQRIHRAAVLPSFLT
jgi:hypothetical protein